MDILPLKYFGYLESLKNLEDAKTRSTLWAVWSGDEGDDEEIFASFTCVFKIISGSSYLLNLIFDFQYFVCNIKSIST